jgi:hypothetical protein
LLSILIFEALISDGFIIGLETFLLYLNWAQRSRHGGTLLPVIGRQLIPKLFSGWTFCVSTEALRHSNRVARFLLVQQTVKNVPNDHKTKNGIKTY